MVEFHRRYHASGAKAESLRQARLATLRNSATRHPFYWSAFVVVGP
jgi:CHAT domain-containing protein